jgi:DNA-directed RNA polymerase specialized sigma24 family protein
MKATEDQTYNISTEVFGPGNKMEAAIELCSHVKEEIKKLEEPYRSVIYQREIKELQLADIADKFGWPLSTVKTRLRKARKDVHYAIQKKHPELMEIYYEIN